MDLGGSSVVDTVPYFSCFEIGIRQDVVVEHNGDDSDGRRGIRKRKEHISCCDFVDNWFLNRVVAGMLCEESWSD